MRLAGTAAPLPRKSGRQESNLRSPAPKPAGWPAPPQPEDDLDLQAPVAAATGMTGAATNDGRSGTPLEVAWLRRSRSQTSRGYSGGRARTCASRVTVARLTSSTTPE